MGLDMYLYADYFVWDCGAEGQDAITVRKAIKEVLGDTPGRVTNIITEAAYWRKANAIHKWFVDNVQDGVDECQRTYVDRDQLRTLRDLCLKVFSKPSDGEKILPTQSGFFFGETDYDEDYFEDIKYTIKQLDVVLDEKKFPKGLWDFYYSSSW